MRLNRFIGNFDLSKKPARNALACEAGGEVEITNPETIKQIKAVLRLKTGDKIVLSDGRGKSAEVTLIEFSKNKILGVVTGEPHSAKASRGENRKVNLYLSILKKENFELAIQKAVECGVSKVIPVVTERTVKTGLNFERLEKIILEASEQSGRDIVPQLFPILPFKDALLEGSSVEEKIIFDLENKFYTPNKSADEVSIFIGPEGGFTEKEIDEAVAAGYTVASLGELTLRGETAAIVATYRAVNAI